MHLSLNPYMTLGDFGIEAEVHGVLQGNSLHFSISIRYQLPIRRQSA